MNNNNDKKTPDYYIDLEKRCVANTYNPLQVVIQEGHGVWVTDVEGKRYLDCLSAYSAVSQGHCHVKIQKAMQEQLSKVTLTSRAFYNNRLGPFLELLTEMTGYDRVVPMNTGAEAVETAIKAARKWGYVQKGVPLNCAEIVVCKGNFHGRTTTIVGFSSESQYKQLFGPPTPGFRIIPYNNVEALEKAITPNTVAFLVEPIQGEGGVIVPSDGYLQKVSQICKANNVLLIADEIQTGLGRTGRLFASDHENVRPDIITIGKALSGGYYPVSAVLADDKVLGLFEPGDHGSTFGGNPLAAVVAKTALEVLRDEELVDRSATMGAYFMGCLECIKSSIVKEVRGKGLLIGVELTVPARPYAEALMQLGVLAMETHERVLRFAPPLVITKDEIDWAIERIELVLTDPQQDDAIPSSFQQLDEIQDVPLVQG